MVFRMPNRVTTGFKKIELKYLDAYLEEENVDLDGMLEKSHFLFLIFTFQAFDLHGELDGIKNHKYYKELENEVFFTPEDNPVRANITIKNNGRKWAYHIRNVSQCFLLPHEIGIDFFCQTTSSTRLILLFIFY